MNDFITKKCLIWLVTISLMIHGMLPAERGSPCGVRPYNVHSHVMNYILGVLCSGAPWRDLPGRYAHLKTIYNRFNRRFKAGIINRIFNKLLHVLEGKKLVDWVVIALDGSKVRALKAAAGAKKTSR